MDGDGSGVRVAAITTTLSGWDGEIPIAPQSSGINRDRFYTPPALDTVATGTTARRIIDLLRRDIVLRTDHRGDQTTVRDITLPEISPAAVARSAATEARQAHPANS